MRLKNERVRMVGMHPALIEAIFSIDDYLRNWLGYDPVITSANDSAPGRKRNSAHYRGMAVDFRTWTTDTSGLQLPWDKKNKLENEIRHILGRNFDVLGRSVNLHIEYDPKSPT